MKTKHYILRKDLMTQDGRRFFPGTGLELIQLPNENMPPLYRIEGTTDVYLEVEVVESPSNADLFELIEE